VASCSALNHGSLSLTATRSFFSQTTRNLFPASIRLFEAATRAALIRVSAASWIFAALRPLSVSPISYEQAKKGGQTGAGTG
jgi:hypothetical protein